jgi:hypothetical protein
MDNFTRTINRIISTIQWRKIKSFHKKLNILWEFENEKGEDPILRVPTVLELKDELKSLLKYMKEEDCDYLSYGNWVIFWERGNSEIGDIRVIFRLADFQYEENREDKDSLELALQKAIENEDYEYAAIIRDTLQKNENKD